MAKKVLLVEDDDANRALLARLIRNEGYEVVSARTFQEGRQFLRTEHPDLLITDVRLGAFNGLQLIVGVAERTPTIVLTAFADAVIEAETRKAGARYLVKPVPAQTLLQTVRATLEASASAAPERPLRRWTRKAVAGGLPANIDSSPGKILDLSYGGLRITMGPSRDEPLPSSFHVTLPSGSLALPVDLVWQSVTDRGALECGVAVSTITHETALAWQGLVDAIP
jgi:DNA-binding response OmpR family regulator